MIQYNSIVFRIFAITINKNIENAIKLRTKTIG